MPIIDEEGPTRTNSGGYGVDGSRCTIIVLWVMQVFSIGMTGSQILASQRHAAMLPPCHCEARICNGTNMHGQDLHRRGQLGRGYYC